MRTDTPLNNRRSTIGLSGRRNFRLFLSGNSSVVSLLGATITGWSRFIDLVYHKVQTLVQETGKALFRRIAMLAAVLSLLIVLEIFVVANAADAWNRTIPSEYGKVIIKNYS